MRHRLGHAVEHQSDADASREEHRAPCSEREIRLRIVGSKLDPAVAAEGKDQDRDEEDDDGPDIEPPERIQHPALYVLEEIGRASCRERVYGWVGAVSLKKKEL